MIQVKNKNDIFEQGLNTLGFDFDYDDCLFFIDTPIDKLPDPQILFFLEKAKAFSANAVYLRKQLNGSYKPQVYLYDFTDRRFNNENQNDLTEVQKKIWSSGEAPLACIFYDTEIKILNCTTHIKENYSPAHLVTDLKYAGTTHRLYNKHFALKIKSGIFWEEKENKNKFSFRNSSYDKLIANIRHIANSLRQKYKSIPKDFINKIIIQSILIKYLEERIDDNGNKLLSDKYFRQYDKSSTFNDVLRKKGKFVDLLIDLNDPEKGFNGNVFEWSNEEQDKLRKIDLSELANLLDTNSSLINGQLSFWRYFEFKFIPVELISRLYEEFLAGDIKEEEKKTKKKKEGLYYTPSHLVQLLVDESIPLKKYNDIDPFHFQILDPACGSGIFLVTVFKRLVQIWRLKNQMDRPKLSILKKILYNIYGIDKERQAVRLTSFSLCLALCNELEPIDIINNLKFDDLRKTNIIESDFFIMHILQNNKFDLIIGNPPFNTGALKNYSSYWEYEGNKVKIPQGQIALKFISESIAYLKKEGLLCLIIKSSGLLYNSTSEHFKKLLFSNLNVVQILDFTALARNKSLWDNGADVAAAAIFIRIEKPNFNNNILHLTFRRTKATRERIIFEIDDYDLHFVNRQTSIDNSFIWKNNLLGGGRIKNIINKFHHYSFNAFLKETNCIVGEGFKIGSKGDLNPSFIYEMKTIPTDAVDEEKIDLSKLKKVDKNIKFEKIPNELVFKAPNIIIWENIGEKRIPIHLNKKSFSFQHKIVGISNHNDISVLNKIITSFDKFNNFYRFYLYVTSGQVLVNLNTTILKADIMRIPFIEANSSVEPSEIDNNIIDDVNKFMQDFIRHGEKSKAISPVGINEFEEFITNFGNEFSKVLNLIYEDKKKKFRLSEVVKLDNAFIATVFKYDDKEAKPVFQKANINFEQLGLSNYEVSKQLNINRIIKLYPQKDTIVFIKPNQYRYWLSLIAYRDADKCFSDLSQLGY